jgi:transposase
MMRYYPVRRTLGQTPHSKELRLGVSTREQVLSYVAKGMKASDIAFIMAISRQRVYQILKNPEKKKVGRKPYMDEAAENQVKAILSTRDSWTWVEAETELSEHDLQFPAMKIFDWLRELGFQKTTRNSATWFRE